MTLSERKKRILQVIVHDYISSAEPVGSRTISRRYKLSLSPATIRNEMADLEDLGYLEQPHTSAGRIPSQRGYRFYVDSLMEKPVLKKEEIAAIERIIQQAKEQAKRKDIDKLITQVSRTLSSLTRYTSLIVGPKYKESAIKQLKILPLDQDQGLIVLVTDTGFVKHRVIKLPLNLNKEELEQIVSYLNFRFSGLTIDKITARLLREVRTDLIKHMDILKETLNLIEETSGNQDARLFLGGTTNILNQPEFRDIQKVKNLLELFEEGSLLSGFLGNINPEGIAVLIGEENKLDEIRDCSLIITAYRLGDKKEGTIGILGPTRMEYARVIAMLNCLVTKLDDILSE
ncbi:MAG TPA: heat-inducible transcription repressor HrcA [Firmicutes bacterium]|nr:heat-inducible transcription repressor HrcA [Bacillota bacterium]